MPSGGLVCGAGESGGISGFPAGLIHTVATAMVAGKGPGKGRCQGLILGFTHEFSFAGCISHGFVPISAWDTFLQGAGFLPASDPSETAAAADVEGAAAPPPAAAPPAADDDEFDSIIVDLFKMSTDRSSDDDEQEETGVHFPGTVGYQDLTGKIVVRRGGRDPRTGYSSKGGATVVRGGRDPAKKGRGKSGKKRSSRVKPPANPRGGGRGGKGGGGDGDGKGGGGTGIVA